MDELGSIAHLAMKNEWEWYGEKEDEEGRAKENREKRNSSKEFLEEDRACKKRRGQKPQETGREEARSGGFGSSSGDRFRPSPARHRLGRSESAALTRLQRTAAPAQSPLAAAFFTRCSVCVA